MRSRICLADQSPKRLVIYGEAVAGQDVVRTYVACVVRFDRSDVERWFSWRLWEYVAGATENAQDADGAEGTETRHQVLSVPLDTDAA